MRFRGLGEDDRNLRARERDVRGALINTVVADPTHALGDTNPHNAIMIKAVVM